MIPNSLRNIFCADPSDPSYGVAMAEEGDQVAAEQNLCMEEFIEDADFFSKVQDAQYTTPFPAWARKSTNLQNSVGAWDL